MTGTSTAEVVEALRESLKENERLRARNQQLVESVGEPMAIIGISCRYPGGVRSPEDLWRLVDTGVDAISEFPTDRGWDRMLSRSEGAENPGSGGFLYDAGDFDAEFFGVSPREALLTDPQQRLLLEASWEVLERAGIDPASLRGSSTGVFIGTHGQDYAMLPTGGDTAYLATGANASVLSGRVAYNFGFEGPAVSVDTACSSSLVAIHLAAHALRSGECSLAMVGGVSVISEPCGIVAFARQGGMAADGRCKAFATDADGTGFAEGVGVLLLERLSDARRRGHRILATVRGSAVNSDGASNGFTAPNGPCQEAVIRQALANARLSPSDVDVVEAHGTGTALGDPIEAHALLATYGDGRDPDRPLWLGSLKSNIGHTQGSAGIAGVIKMVMAIRNGVLPPTLHVGEPSRHIDWSSGGVRLLTERCSWPDIDRPRRAGVSSFGLSGTNAHLIVEQAAEDAGGTPDSGSTADDTGDVSLPIVPCVLSAASEAALAGQAGRLLASSAEAGSAWRLTDVGLSLAITRGQLKHRAAVLAADRTGLEAGLRAIVNGDTAENVVRGAAGRTSVALLLPGQGAQWAGMGKRLHGTFPEFAAAFDAAVDRLDEHLARHLDTPVRTVVFADDGTAEAELIDETVFTQAGLFAFSVALVRLLEHWGIRPGYLLGHSIGELAVAHIAGILSLDDAAKLVAARGRLMQALPAGGSMASIRIGEHEAAALLTELRARVDIAAINSPNWTVISGPEAEIDRVVESVEQRGRAAKPMWVSHAFHSSLMDGMLAEFEEIVRSVSFGKAAIPVVSALTGDLIGGTSLSSPEYWVRQVREPVRFLAGVRTLRNAGVRDFVELLPMLTQECFDDHDEDALAVAACRRNRSEIETLLAAVATLHVRGACPDWGTLFAGTGARVVELPTYAFQRQRYWLDHGDEPRDIPATGMSVAQHPLLSATVALAEDGGHLFTGTLSVAKHAWLADHTVYGVPALPATAFADLAFGTGNAVGCDRLEELVLEAPLVLPADGGVDIQIRVGPPDANGHHALSVHARTSGTTPDDTWTRHASGMLAPSGPARSGAGQHGELAHWPPAGAVALDITELYPRFAEGGIGYGPAFQGLVAAWWRGEELFAEVALPERVRDAAGSFDVHPALLDAALHAMGLTDGPAERDENEEGTTRLPFSLSDVRLYAAGVSSLRARIVPLGPGEVALEAADDRGHPVLSIGALTTRPVSPESVVADGAPEPGSLFGVEWLRYSPEPPVAPHPSCARLGPPPGPDRERASPWYPGIGELLAAHPAGNPVPELVLATCPHTADDPERLGSEGTAAAVRDALSWALGLIRAWLAEDELAGSKLVFVTSGAVSEDVAAEGIDEQPSGEPGRTDPPVNLAQAAIRGLVRSAQSEHPGRFVLVDQDGDDPGIEDLLGTPVSDEPELAFRAGVGYVPRLVRVPEPDAGGLAFDRDGTVLVTGATGGVGREVLRHLVGVHGARHLLLTSRRGRAAGDAAEFEAELRALGADATLVACDVSDRAATADLLASIPQAHPLTAVVHLAGVVDDGVVESLTEQQCARALWPKVDGVLNLHELTRGLDLSAFVVFSSAAATFGSPGQGNYAAANTFVDVFARHRRACGLPAQSLAWGAWSHPDGLAGRANQAGASRSGRDGAAGLTTDAGLRLFDLATTVDRAVVVPMALDPAALPEPVPAMLRSLTRSTRQRSAAGSRPAGDAGSSLRSRLAGLPDGTRAEVVLDLVLRESGVVLGYRDGEVIDPDRSFRDLGIDSLTALELRNGLAGASGLRLPATLVFDYPTPAAVADFLRTELAGAAGPAEPSSHAHARTSDEPIALVGMACRYPGGVYSPENLWRLVDSGADAVSAFPDNRGWCLDTLFHPDPDHPGTTYAMAGGFLHAAGEFDGEFFGIGPREALATDPQQRLLLEVSWEAFERAGIDGSALRGTDTAVFMGAMYHDYPFSDGGGGIVSGRLAYTFGLEGPALTVDTACSSSLVALHLACQSLRAGESSLALAGGVTVMATPRPFVEFSRQRGLAPDGRCKAFAAAADGTGWSEGAGVLVLERLSEARANGHPVLALVRGTAVNSDGASNGLTAPNGPAQERVIRQALANARLSPSDVDAVEGHGTGTTLGDPIEARALLATYGRDRAADRALWLGSLKSNIGHSQAASGVAGVIKMVMAMSNGVLPRTLHVDEPSPHVDWSAGGVRLLTEAADWPAVGRARRAGVSSFGVSGTNAHVIIEQAAPVDEAPDDADRALSPPVAPLVLSGRNELALRAQAARLASRLESDPEAGLDDVAYSLATTRSAMDNRAAVIAGDRSRVLLGLHMLADGQSHASVHHGQVRKDGKLAFMFSGQGGQRAGMGRELYRLEPAFATALDEVCLALDEHLDRPITEIMFAAENTPESSLLNETVCTQPALFALEVALYRMFEQWGLRPEVVFGHSLGELAAAHVAGVLSLEDAGKLVTARGRLMQELPDAGVMIALEATEAELAPALRGRESSVALAAVNDPGSVVLAGEASVVTELARYWESRGRRSRRLAISRASHSPFVDGMLDEFRAVAAGLSFAAPRIPVISTRTGELVTGDELRSPDYWARQVRDTVRFADAVTAAQDAGATAFVELGPDGPLAASAHTCLSDRQGPFAIVPALRQGRSEAESLSTTLARLHVHGLAVDWQAVFAPRGARRVDLPTYAFQRSYYWSRGASNDAGGQADPAMAHPLLTSAVDLAETGSSLYTGRISLEAHPWLGDHAVSGRPVLPATAFLELAGYLGDLAGSSTVDELVLRDPLVLPESEAIELQVRVDGADALGRRPITMYSRRAGEHAGTGWTTHAEGVLAQGVPVGRHPVPELLTWPPVDATPVEFDDLYERLAEYGLDYGPAFQGLRALWRRGDELFAEIRLPERDSAVGDGFGVYPGLLDAALHALGPAARDAGDTVPRMPFSWTGVSMIACRPSALRVRISQRGRDEISLMLTDSNGEFVASVGALNTRPLAMPQAAADGTARTGSLFRLTWPEMAGGSTPGAGAARRYDGDDHWAVVGVDGRLGEAIAGQGIPTEHYRDLTALHEAVAAGAPVPATVLIEPDADIDPERSLDELARADAHWALSLVQTWLAAEQFETSRLVVVTRGAQAVDPADEVAAVRHAVLWGLVRSAHSEHPGRFGLLDLDEHAATPAMVVGALDTREPAVAIRGGAVRIPRLAHIGSPAAESALRPFTSEGIVLITGGTGALGGAIARHLVTTLGVRRLLLLSRRGRDAPGAVQLESELTTFGATITVAACDIADRNDLERVLGGIDPAHPLTAVVHTAGVLDDGLIESLSAQQLDTVLRAKVDGAVHLHELTGTSTLDAFVMFSSASAVFGSAGQGNYAAANAFLDALAQFRRARGLPGTSLAWGLWAQDEGMGHGRPARDHGRSWQAALSTEDALELFEESFSTGEALAVPLGIEPGALGTTPDSLPHPLRSLAKRRTHSRSADARLDGPHELLRGITAASVTEQDRVLLRLVRECAAQVLGYQSADAVPPDRGFLEAGFDSLAALELRNQLGEATGLRLPASIVFDQGDPESLAGHLAVRLRESAASRAGTGSAAGSGGAAEETPPVSVADLYWDACERGHRDEATGLLFGLSRLRPTFGSDAVTGTLIEPVRLSRGTSPWQLFCFPSFHPASGPHEYSGFAAALRDDCDVTVLPQPGYQPGQLLPATLSALVEAHAEVVRSHADCGPVVLIGRSASGLLAHATARHLESIGSAPAAIVLLDTYSRRGLDGPFWLGAEITKLITIRDEEFVVRNDHRLIATSAYLRLFDEWWPTPISTPTALFRATRPFSDDMDGPVAGNKDWRTSWELPHVEMDIPGDHFTILEDCSGSTAEAVRSWLRTLPGETARDDTGHAGGPA